MMIVAADAAISLDADHLAGKLAEGLNSSDFEMVMCRVREPLVLVHMAVRDQQAAIRARRDGHVKMNVHQWQVQDKHVAELYEVSAATVSRAMKKARNVLSEVA